MRRHHLQYKPKPIYIRLKFGPKVSHRPKSSDDGVEPESKERKKIRNKWFDNNEQTWKFIIIMLIDVNFVLEWFD